LIRRTESLVIRSLPFAEVPSTRLRRPPKVIASGTQAGAQASFPNPIDRFQSDAQLARHAGVAPLDASSGKHQRHRLDRGGNRQLNCALHRIAVTQGRVHAPAKAYLERKQAEGKSRREALRCLKRQLARTVYTTLKSKPLLT
jgi:transposase